MSTERERTFICSVDQARTLSEGFVPHHITQTYLSPLGASDELRTRRDSTDYTDPVFTATVKRGQGEYREEQEVDLLPASYNKLGVYTCAALIKNRYQLDPQAGITLDTYPGNYHHRLWGRIEVEQQPGSGDIGLFNIASLGVGDLTEITGVALSGNRHIATELPRPSLETTPMSNVLSKIRTELGTARQPVIVTLGGPSASGKTTLLEKFKREFGDACTVISTDNYYIGKTRMRREMPEGHAGNFDHPDAIDTRRIARDLARLRQGQTIDLPWYDMKTSEPELSSPLAPSPLIIVEGLVANHPDVRNTSNLSLNLTAPVEERLRRRAQRDIARKGHDAGTTMDIFMNQVEPSYLTYHAPNDAGADYTISS